MAPGFSVSLLDSCVRDFGDLLILEYAADGALVAQFGESGNLHLEIKQLSTLLALLDLPQDWVGRAEVHVGTRTLIATRVVEGDASTVLLHDISAFARREWDLRREAETDHLTGIANRRGFELAVPGILRRPASPGCQHLIGLVDVDDLKAMNDTHGHAAGDALLRAVAGRLTSATRQRDCVARIGGDEFAFCLVDIPQEHEAAILARFQDGGPLTQDGGTMSIGVTRTSGATDRDNLAALMDAAEARMMQAKSQGKNRLVV